jgi:hypothetical protein
MDQNFSFEGDSCVAVKKFHSSRSVRDVVTEFARFLIALYFEIDESHLRFGPPSAVFRLDFPINILYVFLISHKRVTYSTSYYYYL